MFEKGDPSNKKKMNGCSFQQLTAKFDLVFVLAQEDPIS